MAINPTVLITGADATNSSQYTSTASVSPSANALLTLCVAQQSTSVSPADTPTVSGLGVTWAQHATQLNAGQDLRITLFRAQHASPTAGTFQVNYTNPQGNFTYRLVEWAGVSTAGTNGDAAIVQFVSTNASSSNLTMTLPSAFGSADNAGAAFFASRASTSFTVEAGWSELAEETMSASPAQTLAAAWRAGEDLSVTGSFTTTQQVAGIMLELSALTISGPGAAAGGGGVASWQGAVIATGGM